MSYVPPPSGGAAAVPAPEPGGRMSVGLALSLGPEIFLGLANLFVADGWVWLVLLAWMALCFAVGLVLALIKSVTRVGAGMLIGAALGVIVAGGSCIGFIATQGNL